MKLSKKISESHVNESQCKTSNNNANETQRKSREKLILIKGTHNENHNLTHPSN